MKITKCVRIMCVAVLALMSNSLMARQPAAAVRVAKVFSSHMVLQQDKPINIWGWAGADDTVTVQFQSEKVEAKANDKGEWKAVLPAVKAGGPYTLTVTGVNAVKFDDVMVGEVWVCSGQSNMEMGMGMINDAQKEIAAADHPGIRLLLVTRKWSPEPQQDIDGTWKICTPKTVTEGGWSGFSAAAYFFGRELHKQLNVPIGLIESSWGGTKIESWTPPEGFAAVPALKDIKLKPPHDLQQNMALFNGQLHPLVPVGIRGAIWYQGESNMGEGMLYTERMKALIGGWRQVWGQGDFPFYFVQIAPYKYGSPPEVEAEIWEAQAAAAQVIPNTGMAVINDIGNLGDIHPKNKQEVGRRLALLALANTYGQKSVVDSGPVFKTMKIEGNKIRVSFDHVDGGLASRGGKPLDWFEVLDANGDDYVKAETQIDGATVVVYAADAPHPVAVRYAWSMLAEPHLMNAEGLPAGAFRSSLPVAPPPRNLLETKVPEAKDYQLVYDMDLSKLGAAITYDVDNHAKIQQPFDRIAYFLELQGSNGKVRYLYVSMDAFTDDIAKIGIPVVTAGARFQQNVQKLNVVSNVKGIVTGTGLDGGNIEFWPNNYGQGNSAAVPGAEDKKYDFGDQPTEPADGYGCMQVHNHDAKQTLFSINNWKSGADADIGIGNSPGGEPDWTFTKSARLYGVKRLRVLVHLK
jgi:sialate O-acetylesterase